MELQMILCRRAVGSAKDSILSKDSEAAFKSLPVALAKASLEADAAKVEKMSVAEILLSVDRNQILEAQVAAQNQEIQGLNKQVAELRNKANLEIEQQAEEIREMKKTVAGLLNKK